MKVAHEILMLEVEALRPYDNNARINDHVVSKLKESILRFGFNSPIVITKDNVVICGHTRLKAAFEIGMAKVPCVRIEGLTEAEIQAYRLADNKIGELALWDMDKLDKELKSIEDLIDMKDFGFEPVIVDTGALDDSVAGGVEPEPEPNDDDDDVDPQEPKPRLHKCPHCGEVFED